MHSVRPYPKSFSSAAFGMVQLRRSSGGTAPLVRPRARAANTPLELSADVKYPHQDFEVLFQGERSRLALSSLLSTPRSITGVRRARVSTRDEARKAPPLLLSPDPTRFTRR